MSERFDVVVVGSGAGGGVVAGELAQRGRNVVLLEAGPHLTAADFVRWEAKAAHDFWWPLRMAMVDGGAGGTVPIFGGRCVGGTTTMNTKVSFRAHDFEFAKWHEASGLVGDGGKPFGVEDLGPHYERVEKYLGVRERADWPECVRTLDAGFRELGSMLEPVDSYTDVNCMKCGSCLQGCPTNAGKNTMNTYIHDATAFGKLDLRASSPVERVLFEERNGGLEATGVEYADPDGRSHTIEAGAVVVAAGALNTPQLLIRSGLPRSERRLAQQRVDRAQPGPPPRRLRLRPLRRGPGRPPRLPDHLALHGLHARRGRRLRARGVHHPGPDRLRDQHLGRGRADVGRAPGGGGPPVPQLERDPDPRQRREQRPRGGRRGRHGELRGPLRPGRARADGRTGRTTPAA